MKTSSVALRTRAPRAANPAAQAMASISALLEDRPGTALELLDGAARMLATTPGEMCLISLPTGPDRALLPIIAAHVRPAAMRRLRAQLAWHSSEMTSDAFSREVARTGGSLHLRVGRPRMLSLWLPRAIADLARRAGVREVLAVAMRSRAEVIGCLLLWRGRGMPPFDAHDVVYVTEVARRLAAALERA